MSVILASTAQERLSLGYNGTGSGTCGYNGETYDETFNPGGMDGNGVAVNWLNMCNDLVSIGVTTATMAVIASQYAEASNGWTKETATIARISPSQFSVVGDKTAIYEKNRALSIIQTSSGYGYIASSSYESISNLTIVTVIGISLDAGLTSIYLGQAVEHAPYSSGAAGTLLIISNFITS